MDLRREIPRPAEKGIPLFSGALVDRLEEVFARGEQAILLQPRRGYAPFLLCRECGHDFRCSRCSVARTVHARGRTLVCHYCGERVGRPPRCPECAGALLEAIGAGTERVAERFAEQFPGVSYAVLDRDSARRGGVGAIVDGMLSGSIACLIGTQMVAKGHDFPGVTAVGVLSADTLLNFPDFRAAERTFQLVSQVSGRAGRGDRPGTVHVQTFHPDHPAIRRAASHDLEGFAAAELEFRRTFFYPPFSDLASILVSSPHRERAEEAAETLGRAARASSQTLRISGPAPAPLERLQGKWRFQILLRAGSRKSVLEALESIVAGTAAGGRLDRRGRGPAGPDVGPADTIRRMNGEDGHFEEPILKLRRRIEELSALPDEASHRREIEKLREKLERVSREIYASLTPWQKTLVARHPARPYTLDYIEALMTDFVELHGDRKFADDAAIVAGFADFRGRPVALVGHQKGRDTKEKVRRNFGMPRPEGYRKALRVMQLAEKFGRPILTFLDTVGAYPGIDAEERGQAEAIAANLQGDGRVPRAHHRDRDGRRRIRRRARAGDRGPHPHDGARGLLRHLPRSLRGHPLARREPEEGVGRGAQAHGEGSRRSRRARRDHPGAAGGRPRRSGRGRRGRRRSGGAAPAGGGRR